jgi:hypothetical protein
MRTFVPKQRPAPKTKPASSTTAGALPSLQRTGVNQAVQRLLGHEISHEVKPTGGPALQRKEMTAETKLDRVLRAAARARRDPEDRVHMLRNGSEIVYRLIDLYLPTYSHLLSGVSYDASVATIRAETTAGDTVSIKVGKQFILETNRSTLAARATEIGTELSRWESLFKVDPDEDQSFKDRVWALMDDLMTSSEPGLQLLYERLLHSPVPIGIVSVSDDASTWHIDELRMAPRRRPTASERRSHTAPSDSKPRGAERDTPTGSTIFINPFRLDPVDETYEHGVFVHELVHALDLAYGLYNSEKEIRERRAVFFQNMWRDAEGERFRKNYHGDFVTEDYQKAVKADNVAAVTAHLLSHNDLPKEGP